MDHVLCGIYAPSGAGNYQREICQFLWSHRSEMETDLVIFSGDKSFKVHQAAILPLSAHLTELLPPTCPCTKSAIYLPSFPSHVLTAAIEILYTGTTTRAASQEDQIKVKEVFALLKIKADVDKDINIEGELNDPIAIPENEQQIPENDKKITPPPPDSHSCHLHEATGVFYNDEKENVKVLDDPKSCKMYDKEPSSSSSFKFIHSQGPAALGIILNEVTGMFCYAERQDISGLDEFEHCKINNHENVEIVAGNDEGDEKVAKLDNNGDGDEKVFKLDNNENDITKCPEQAKRKNLTKLYTFGNEEELSSTASQTPKLRAKKRKAKEPDEPEVRREIKGLDRNHLSSMSKPQPGNKKLKVTGLDGSTFSSVKSQSSSKFACSKCDYTSKKITNLKRHIGGVHTKSLYTCNECDYTTTWDSSLIRHIEAVHEKTSYSCDKCDFATKWKENVKTHIEFVHQGIYYDCDKCDFKTAYKQNLKNHIDAMHLKISHNCDQCNYTTKWKHTLKKHIHAAHQNMYFNCDQCEFKTMWKTCLKSHIDAHKNIYFKCYRCDYETAWKGNFQRHIEGAHKNISYNCNQCNFTTTRKEYLQRHIKGSHAGVPLSGSSRNQKAVDKPAVPSGKSVHGEVTGNCRARTGKMSPDVAVAVNSSPRMSESPDPIKDKNEQKRFQKKSKNKRDAAFLW